MESFSKSIVSCSTSFIVTVGPADDVEPLFLILFRDDRLIARSSTGRTLPGRWVAPQGSAFAEHHNFTAWTNAETELAWAIKSRASSQEPPYKFLWSSCSFQGRMIIDIVRRSTFFSSLETQRVWINTYVERMCFAKSDHKRGEKINVNGYSSRRSGGQHNSCYRQDQANKE